MIKICIVRKCKKIVECPEVHNMCLYHKDKYVAYYTVTGKEPDYKGDWE